MPALGIIAGGGDLPLAVAEAAQNAGREVFILALKGAAGDEVARFPHEWNSLGEVGRAMKLLRAHDVSEVLLAGQVSRPRFSDVKLDVKGMFVLPRVVAAARKGDNALLDCMVAIFEEEGFRTIGVADAAPSLIASSGALGKLAPKPGDLDDVAVAVRVVRAMGALDIGQAAAVCEGLVLAVEAAEGTDKMIARVAQLPEAIRGKPSARRGVLLKAPKPQQDGKTDLPVIGTATVRNAAEAGLAGIAIEAGAALIMGRAAVAKAADDAGLFVYGFSKTDYPS